MASCCPGHKVQFPSPHPRPPRPPAASSPPLAFPVYQISSVPFLLGLVNFPSSLFLAFKPQRLLPRWKEVLLICSACQNSGGTRHFLGLPSTSGVDWLQTTHSLSFSLSSPPFPSPPSHPPFFLPLFSPPLLPQSLSSFPFLVLISMSFRSLVPILETTKLRLREVHSDPQITGPSARASCLVFFKPRPQSSQ